MDTLNLVRGYLDHESAHLRMTNFDVLKDANLAPIEKHVWTIIEDFMVERELAAIYPGCEQNFNWLMKHLFLSENGKDTEIEESDVTAIFNWILISLRALSVPDLQYRKTNLAKTLEEKYPGLISVLEPLVLAVPGECHDTLSCIGMAKRIIACIRSYDEGQRQKDQTQDGDTGSAGNSVKDNGNIRNPENGGKSEDRKNACGAGSNGADVQSMNVPDGDEDNVQSDCGNDSQTGCSKQSGEEIQAVIGQLEDSGQQKAIPDEADHFPDIDQTLEKDRHPTLQEILDDPSCMKSQDIGELAGKLLEYVNQEGSYHHLEVATEFPVQYGSLTQSEITDIRQQTSALRTRLTGMLQAKTLSRNHIGRHGRVDQQRIARLTVNDPKIFARDSHKQGVNTAVHILLDASGSMSGEKMALPLVSATP